MYKKIILLTLTFSLLAFPVKAFAVSSINANMQEARDQRKAALDDLKETLAANREEFKAKLAELKDQKKALILQRISEQIDDKNAKWMAHFKNVLTRLTAILEKVKTRTDKAETAGLDVSEVRILITKAETAIQTATDAVTVQEAKSYAIDITDETKLKTTAGEVIKELKEDLTATRKIVFDARQAVIDAIKALGLVLEEEETE